MAEQYPREYEYVDGNAVKFGLGGRKVPIPPEWVRNRITLPPRGKNACLSKEIADLYPAPVRETLVKYVSQWPQVKKSGTDLIVAGSIPSRRLRWAAAAVMNEVVMRYGAISAISTEWFGVGRLNFLQDARDKRADEYAPIRNRIFKAKLLMVENPLGIDRNSAAFWFVKALYQHRYDNQLPTITTLSTDVREGWDGVRRALGPDIADTLRENNHGFIAHY